MRGRLLIAAIVSLPLAAHADTVRAAVGKPVEQAQALIRTGDYAAAFAKLRKAAAVPDRTPYENLVIAELRGTAAADAGDYSQAANAYQSALATGAVPAAQQTPFVQAIAGFYARAGDNADALIWLNRYIAAGGQDAATRALLAQTYYQSGDYANADHAAAADIAVQLKAGRKPLESEWQILASAAEKTGDQPGYQTALEGLLADDPRPQYWSAAIDRLLAIPNFPDRLTLDVYRLRRATGTLTAPGDYEDYAERAILAGHPEEAKAVLADGFAKGILTAQTDSGHAARLRALVNRRTAQTPTSSPRRLATRLPQACSTGASPISTPTTSQPPAPSSPRPQAAAIRPRPILTRHWRGSGHYARVRRRIQWCPFGSGLAQNDGFSRFSCRVAVREQRGHHPLSAGIAALAQPRRSA